METVAKTIPERDKALKVYEEIGLSSAIVLYDTTKQARRADTIRMVFWPEAGVKSRIYDAEVHVDFYEDYVITVFKIFALNQWGEEGFYCENKICSETYEEFDPETFATYVNSEIQKFLG